MDTFRLHQSTTQLPPKINKCLDQACDSYDFKMPFTNNHQETLKRHRLIAYKTWKWHSTPGATSEVPGKENARGPGFCFIWVRVGPRVSRAPALLVNLKQKSRDLKFRKRKQVAQKVRIEINPRGSSGSSGSWMTKCLFQPLERMPLPSKLKSRTCIIKKGGNVRACTASMPYTL